MYGEHIDGETQADITPVTMPEKVPVRTEPWKNVSVSWALKFRSGGTTGPLKALHKTFKKSFCSIFCDTYLNKTSKFRYLKKPS